MLGQQSGLLLAARDKTCCLPWLVLLSTTANVCLTRKQVSFEVLLVHYLVHTLVMQRAVTCQIAVYVTLDGD